MKEVEEKGVIPHSKEETEKLNKMEIMMEQQEKLKQKRRDERKRERSEKRKKEKAMKELKDKFKADVNQMRSKSKNRKTASLDKSPEFDNVCFDMKAERKKDRKGHRGDFITDKVTNPNAELFRPQSMPNRSFPKQKVRKETSVPNATVPRQPKTAEQLQLEKKTGSIPRASKRPRPTTAKVSTLPMEKLKPMRSRSKG